MLPAPYNFPDAYRGDSYGPITLSFFDSDKNPVNMESVSAVECQVGLVEHNRTIVLTWPDTTHGISISGNQITLLTVPGDEMKMCPGIYFFDFQISTIDFIQTYIRGNITVYDEITDY